MIRFAIFLLVVLNVDIVISEPLTFTPGGGSVLLTSNADKWPGLPYLFSPFGQFYHQFSPIQPNKLPLFSDGPANRFQEAFAAKVDQMMDDLRSEVNALKDQLKNEVDRYRRLQEQVDQLRSKAEEDQHRHVDVDQEGTGLSEYARLNLNSLPPLFGIGRPWITTFFSFRRGSSFTAIGTPITYDVIDANVGGTVNASSGVFTAPRAGYYYFSFQGVKDPSGNALLVAMYKNGARVTTSYGIAVPYAPLSIQSAQILKVGETVSFQLIGTGSLYDDGSAYFTRFIGFSVALF